MDLTIRLKSKGGVDKYPAKSHARRFREKLGINSGIIVAAGTKNLNWPNSDMPAPFRQDRPFYYLTGCNEPDCGVSYDVDKDKLTLWLPPVDLGWHQLVYYGRGSTVEEALEKYDIDEAQYIKKDPSEADSGAEVSVHSVYCKPVSGRPRLGLFKLNAEDEAILSQQNASKPDLLRRALNACRVIKDEYEINLIRRANDITAEAHTAAFKGMHSFGNEAEVEAAFMKTCIARKAKAQAYDPIAGSGPNAAVLHYSENVAEFGKGQTVVLDAGCEVELYASDVTRTIPINKHKPGHWPSKEAEQIYKLVEKVQESCIKKMLPGNKYIEANWLAHHIVVEGLLNLGILKGDANKIFHAGVSTAFLPHGLGHHVGLDVHDVSPDPPPPAQATTSEVDRLREAYIRWKPEAGSWASELSSLENFAIGPGWHTSLSGADAPVLEPDMIVTVEPGIYFNPVLLRELLKDPKRSQFVDEEVLKRYIPVGGVRIEDDILITKKGYENLTTAPKGEEMLNIIRESARKG
ncbi:hypothetical protein PRZ48_002593 [Zasmidium cellare]|uniref:Xaa-Pro aminopeptidase n=1 Tax=Zasmidium cellare TaxID=395010 RepID=A0ABR0ESQ4_ZASCE|nr:hypothetical protein PRZ48_002593 [Zasmidium cellare]